MNFTIHAARWEDLPSLADLSGKIFLDTYNAEPGEHTIARNERYVQENLSISSWERIHQNPSQTILLLSVGEQILGYAHLDRELIPAQMLDALPIHLHRIYVDSSLHGKGAGKALIDASVEVAKQEGYKSMWLLVWHDNARALRFYEKCGFKHVGTEIFMLFDKAYDDFTMLLQW